MATSDVKADMEACWNEFLTQDTAFQADKANKTAGDDAIAALKDLSKKVREYRIHMKAENLSAQ